MHPTLQSIEPMYWILQETTFPQRKARGAANVGDGRLKGFDQMCQFP